MNSSLFILAASLENVFILK